MMKQDSYTKANESGEEAHKGNHGAYRHWAPSEYEIKLTVTVRPGSKVKYNKGKNKSTSYID